MADEIRQELGIDVSGAVRALDTLDKKLVVFGKTLDGLSGKLKSFNSVARNAFNLGNLTGDLDKAADSSQRVVKGFAGFAQAGQSAAQAGQAAASGFNAASSAAQTAAKSTAALGAAATTGTSQASSAFRRLSSTVSGVVGRINSRLTALLAQMKAFGAQSKSAVGEFTISFQTLGRIISAQVLIRGLNAIGGAFREAVSSAIEFQRQISEIQTIADDAFRDYDNAAEAVRNISDAFNLPLGEVAEGLYQTISNQIKGAADQIAVLESAAVLAKTGVADFNESVELLTGTINAFQLDASRASEVTAIFFKTVQLGRTRVDELNKSIGQVQTLAAEAGASFEELAAAFATVTINGLDTAKAGTQIRGILNAIIKPTKELEQVFEDAGFAEGALAVETLGLADTIQLISDAAGGSQAELGKLIPRIRGITGQLVLGRNAGEKFRDNLDQIRRAAEEGIEREFQIRIETNAERVTKVLNELSNALTVDVGQAVLSVLGFFTQFTGGIQFATRVTQVLIPLLAVAATGFAAYAVKAGVAAAANSAFAATALKVSAALLTNPIVLAAAAIAGTIGVINAARSSAQAALDDAEQRAERAAEARLSEARKTRAELLRIEKEGIRERFREVTDFVRSERKAIAERVDAWNQSNELIANNTEQLFDRLLSANKGLVDDLQQAASDAAQAQEDSVQRVTDIRLKAEDAVFRASLKGRNALQQSFILQQRAADLGRQAAQQLSTAQTGSEVEAALATADRAQSAADEAVSSAETTGNRAAATRAMRTQLDIANQLVGAEQRLQRNQADRQQRAEEAARVEEARVAKLETAINRVLDLQKDFDPTASVVDRKKVLQDLQGAFADVRQNLAPTGEKLGASDLIDLSRFQADILNAFKVSELQGIDVRATLSGEPQRQLSKEIEDTVAEAFRRGLNRAIEAGVSPNAFAQAIDAQQTEGPVQAIDALTTALNAERDLQTQVAENAEKVRRATEDLATAAEAAKNALTEPLTVAESFLNVLQGGVLTDAFAEIPAAIKRDFIGPSEAREQLLALGEEAAVIPLKTFDQSTDQINAQLDDINKRFEGILSQTDNLTRRLIEETIVRTNRSIQIANDAIQKSASQGTQSSEQLESSLKGAVPAAQATETSVKGAATAAGSFQTSSNNAAQNLIDGAQAATTINQQLQAASQLQIGSGGAPVQAQIGKYIQGFARGGFVKYLANGGFAPRGTDTVPAMLSPGEYVVNARSTRKFFSQLQAMNAGVQPRHFQEGGPVTNVTGDINVTVDNSRGGESTGRQIARSLKRELRRNNTSL